MQVFETILLLAILGGTVAQYLQDRRIDQKLDKLLDRRAKRQKPQADGGGVATEDKPTFNSQPN